MADFVQKTVNKTAIRNLMTPIADVTSFTTLVQAFTETTPSGASGTASTARISPA